MSLPSKKSRTSFGEKLLVEHSSSSPRHAKCTKTVGAGQGVPTQCCNGKRESYAKAVK